MKKRIIALVLAIILAIAQSVSVLAMETESPEKETPIQNCCDTDSELLLELNNSLVQKRAVQLSQQISLKKPPVNSIKGSIMPSTGNSKVLVLPIEFPDYPIAGSDVYQENYTSLSEYFFAPYNPDKSPQEQSVRGRLYKFSNGRLDISGNVLPVYMAPYNLSYYEENSSEWPSFLCDVLAYYVTEVGIDLSDYDSDNDGYVDSMAVKHTGSLFKQQTLSLYGEVEFDGTKVGPYTLTRLQANSTRVDVHELGHTMGLMDNYFHDSCYLDIGLMEVMSIGAYYFNVYYQYLLNWTDPVILTNTDSVTEIELNAVEHYLEDSKNNTRAVVWIPEPDLLPFAEYYIAEYRCEGAATTVPSSDIILGRTPGIVLWHCNTYLNVNQVGYLKTDYIQPVYKSGTTPYGEKDVYIEGDEFSSSSIPSSDYYGDIYTGAYMKVKSLTGEKAVIEAGFKDPDLRQAPFVTITGPSKKAVRNDKVTYTVTYTAGPGGELIPWEDLNFANDLSTVNRTGTVSKYIVPRWTSENPQTFSFSKLNTDIKPGDGTVSIAFQNGWVSYGGKSSLAVTSDFYYVDNTAPEIIIKGEQTQTIERGEPYVELGADITDNLDPSIVNKLRIDATRVNTHKSGSYKVTYSADDHAGNSAIMKTRTVVVVDTTPPTATIGYSTTAPTSGNVTATLSPSEEIVVTNNGGSLSHTFTENGSFTFEFRDLAGNRGTATASVSNIDKSLPTGTVSYDRVGLTNEDVTATLAVAVGTKILNNNGQNTYVFTENGSFDFQIENAAGTKGAVTASVDWIDKEPPAATVSYSTTGPTNQNVTATITPSESVTITSPGEEKHIFTENGSFTFTFEDAAGNTGSAEAKVDWIDKTPPAAVVKYNPAGKTDGTVMATVTFTEPIRFVRSKLTQTPNPLVYTMEFTENSDCEISYEDMAGNPGNPLRLSVTWIEKHTNPEPGPGPGPGPGPNPEPDPEPEPEPSPQPDPSIKLPTDVKGHWAEKNIAIMYEKGLLMGYSDRTFRPENKLTRAELCTVLCRYLELEPVNSQSFTDVKGWYAGNIGALSKAGIVDGYKDGTFRPNQNITREEMAVLLNKTLKPENVRLEAVTAYADDSRISSWARQSVYNAKAQGWMVGSGNRFNPKAPASRAEIATIFARLLE